MCVWVGVWWVCGWEGGECVRFVCCRFVSLPTARSFSLERERAAETRSLVETPPVLEASLETRSLETRSLETLLRLS